MLGGGGVLYYGAALRTIRIFSDTKFISEIFSYYYLNVKLFSTVYLSNLIACVFFSRLSGCA